MYKHNRYGGENAFSDEKKKLCYEFLIDLINNHKVRFYNGKLEGSKNERKEYFWSVLLNFNLASSTKPFLFSGCFIIP